MLVIKCSKCPRHIYDPHSTQTMCTVCNEDLMNEAFVTPEFKKLVDEILKKHDGLFKRLAELEELEKKQNDSSQKTDI